MSETEKVVNMPPPRRPPPKRAKDPAKLTVSVEKAGKAFNWLWSRTRELGLWFAVFLLFVDLMEEVLKGARVAMTGIQGVLSKYDASRLRQGGGSSRDRESVDDDDDDGVESPSGGASDVQ